MYKFLLAVAVVGLTACSAKKQEVQGEAAVDSAVVVDSTKINTDSVKAAAPVEVKADAPKAAK